MACNPLTSLARECGKNAVAGLRDEVYLVPFSEMKAISGSTEVYATSVDGLVNQISFASGSTKMVKYGTVKNQNGMTSTFTMAENGSFDFVKELTINLANAGSLEAKKAVENLIGNPVVALVKMRNGKFVIFGLNGQFQMSTSTATVDNATNGKVVVLNGSDEEDFILVDPTIVPSLLAA